MYNVDSVNRNNALLLLELLSSSSSDDDDELIHILKTRPKEIPKIKNFVETIQQLDDQEFRKHFRLLRRTTYNIIEQYNASRIHRTNTWQRGKDQISSEKEILLFMWFATNKCSIRDVAQRFDVSLSTAHNIITKVMYFLIDVAPNYIKFPSTPEEKEKAAMDFEQVAGFPRVLGCIDGTTIPIVTPTHKIKSTYVNRHDIPALTLQGICNAERMFIDVFTGTPAKIHDSRVFKLSDIYNRLPQTCGSNYHLLGDSAYHIREWCITPYRDYGNQTEAQKVFNKKLSKTRVLIENSFGLLKGRFRQLLQVHMHTVDRITKFVISCSVLHNLCILHHDNLIEDECSHDVDDQPQPTITQDSETTLRRLGEVKRNGLKARFM